MGRSPPSVLDRDRDRERKDMASGHEKLDIYWVLFSKNARIQRRDAECAEGPRQMHPLRCVLRILRGELGRFLSRNRPPGLSSRPALLGDN